MADLINFMRAAQSRAEDIAVEGASRGLMPIDLFGALAQLFVDRNPQLGFECLRALEAVVMSRPAVLPATGVKPPLHPHEDSSDISYVGSTKQ